MKASLAEPEIVTKKGKPVSVILPIKQYQEMLERLGSRKMGVSVQILTGGMR